MNIRTFVVLVGSVGAFAVASMGTGCKTTATTASTGTGATTTGTATAGGCTADAQCSVVNCPDGSMATAMGKDPAVATDETVSAPVAGAMEKLATSFAASALAAKT